MSEKAPKWRRFRGWDDVEVASPADIAEEKLEAAGTFGQVEGNLTGEEPIAAPVDPTNGDPNGTCNAWWAWKTLK